MTFEGELVVDNMYYPYTGKISFSKDYMYVNPDKNKENRYPNPQSENITPYEKFAFLNRTKYQIEFMEIADAERTYTDILITYIGIDGRGHKGKLKTDTKNHRIAKWIHRQSWISKHLSEIIIGTITAIIGALIGVYATWLFTCN